MIVGSMKVRNTYILYINHFTHYAMYGTNKFNLRISVADIGQIYDCNFNELIHNLTKLRDKGFTILCMKH